MQNKHNSLEHLNNSYLYLAQIGWEICEPNHSCTGFRDMHLIHIIKSGRGTFEIDGKRHTLEANNLFYMPPNALASYCSDSQEPWEYYYFAFNGSYSPELIQSTIFKNNNYVSKVENCESIINIIRTAAEDIMSKEFPDLYGCEQLFKILPHIMIPKTSEKNTSKYIEEAENYIKAHYHENISINKIAKHLNIDRSYFYRIFKDHFGISPMDYLINIRFQQARKLLSETNLSTNNIAKVVGYENYSPFYLMFQKKMGMTPQEFRLLQLGHNATSEKMSITALRIFKNREECEKLSEFKIADMHINDDDFYTNAAILYSKAYKLSHNSKTYDFFAYEFKNELDASAYFKNASGVIPQDKNLGFKFKATHTSTELIVFKNRSVYRLCSENIESLNQFRHVINDRFTSVVSH